MNNAKLASGTTRCLASSPLLRLGGATVVDCLGPADVALLCSEAAALRSQAKAAQRMTSNDSVRGDPDRFLDHIVGGPLLHALYGSEGLKAILRDLTNVAWESLGADASYSLYGTGQFLGPHRDIVGCDLTMIVVLHDDTPGGHPLWTWPTRATQDISAIRINPDLGRRAIVGHPGQAIVVVGSVVPHQLPPLPPGSTRLVAPLCFRALPG
jgi:hypothetical protein